MTGYDYALGAEAVHAFTAQGLKGRERLLQVFDRLAQNPSAPGDFREPGASGREYEVRLVDGLLVTWWVDHAAREIRVVRLEWV